MTQIVRRFFNEDQLAGLHSVIGLLANEVFREDQHKFYIIIDDLDRFRIDDDIRLRLLRALIDSVQRFRPVRNVKFVIALRNDLLEMIFERTRDAGFQEEKYEGGILEIRWSKDALFRLVDSRIQEVFKRGYSGKAVAFDDLFTKEVNQVKTREFIWERTHQRPRDIITFVNLCFKNASDQNKISQRVMVTAESEYSQKRILALYDEWRSAHPAAKLYFDGLRHKDAVFSVLALEQDPAVRDMLLDLACHGGYDPLAKLAEDHMNEVVSHWRFCQSWLAHLYKFGAVGLRQQRREPTLWSFRDRASIDHRSIAAENFFEVHPMLRSGLAIGRREDQIEH